MGLVRGIARTAVVAGTATAVSNRVSRRQAGRWAEQDQAQYQEAPPQYQQQPQYQQPQYQQPQYQPPPQYQQPPPPPVPVATVAVVPPQAPPAPPAAEDEMSAKLAHLQQLGELKAQGILTDAEFEVQKQRVLTS